MAHRILIDPDGREWQVWDVVPKTTVGATLAGGWLAFQSQTEKRRLTPIPLYWVHASEEELAQLLARARPVPPRVDAAGNPTTDATEDETHEPA